MSPHRPLHVILGGGVAGLTTAYRLLSRVSDPKPRVVILEEQDRPGGLAISLSRNGVVTDLGPHRLHTELPEIKQLLTEVAEPILLSVRRESHLYWRGHRLRYPISPFELLRAIGPIETTKLTSSALLAKAGMIGLPGTEDSFERVLRQQFGAGLWKALLGPYSRKVWKGDPGQLHGDAARVRVSAGGLGAMAKRLLTGGREKEGKETVVKTFRYPKGGLQTLVDLLAKKVHDLGAELHLGEKVERLKLENGEHVIRVHSDRADYNDPVSVTTTVPLSTLSHALGDQLGAGVAQATAGLSYLALRLVVVVVKRERITNDSWLYFFDEGDVLNRAYEPKNFDPSLAPPGYSALCCEVTARPGDAIAEEPSGTLAKRVIASLVRANLFRDDEVDAHFVHDVPWAYPLYTLDYRDRLRALFGDLSSVSNLLPCGRQGLFNHNNTDHSMSMGLAAADHILEHPEAPGTAWFEGLMERFKHFRIVD